MNFQTIYFLIDDLESESTTTASKYDAVNESTTIYFKSDEDNDSISSDFNDNEGSDSENIAVNSTTPRISENDNGSDSKMYIYISVIVTAIFLLIIIVLYCKKRKVIRTEKKCTQRHSFKSSNHPHSDDGPEKSLIDNNERFDPNADVKDQANLLS